MDEKQVKKQVELLDKAIEALLNLYNETCEKGFELTKEDVIRKLESKNK